MKALGIPRAAWLVVLAMVLPQATFAADQEAKAVQELISTAFTYQGTLFDGGVPANDFYDFDFQLYDAAIGGVWINSFAKANVQVVNGYLVINDMNLLDAFRGDRRWLEIYMKRSSSPTKYQRLTPRAEIQPTPYALSLRPGATVTGNPGNPTLSLTGNSGDGLYAESNGLNGVEGRSSASFASGVYGQNLSGGLGVAGRASGTNSRGVWGDNTSGSTGVLGTSSKIAIVGASAGAWYSPGEEFSEIGVLGVAAGCAFPEGCNLGVGVRGISTAGGTGVHASSVSGTGVLVVSGGMAIEAYGPGGRTFYVDASGNVRADGTFASPAADFAELLPSRGDVGPGDVLAIDPDGQLVLTNRAGQTNVAGVYSTKPAFLGGATDQNVPGGLAPLAIVGIVPVKVCDQNGPIQPGDLLVPSSLPGRAMRAGDQAATGTVIGKAMGSLKSGQASIQMLLTLR